MLKGLAFKLLLSELLVETEWSELILIWWFVSHYLKSVRIRSYSGPHFPAFGLNTERYGENEDQNNSEYGHFLCSDIQNFP